MGAACNKQIQTPWSKIKQVHKVFTNYISSPHPGFHPGFHTNTSALVKSGSDVKCPIHTPNITKLGFKSGSSAKPRVDAAGHHPMWGMWGMFSLQSDKGKTKRFCSTQIWVDVSSSIDSNTKSHGIWDCKLQTSFLRLQKRCGRLHWSNQLTVSQAREETIFDLL